MDLEDAAAKLVSLASGRLPASIPRGSPAVGVMPVHVGGLMMDIRSIRSFARDHGLWVVEDAAHAFPAAWRSGPGASWEQCGEATSNVSCFSFYANKTITTGEGGMAVTDDPALADRMRLMSLHGLSQDAWERYSGGRSWDYRIVAPGYKYNLTDVAAAIGIRQLARAELMRRERERVARRYSEAFAEVEELEGPADDPNRIHAWHLYPIRLRLDRLAINRNAFIDGLKDAGVGCSVHWRPLHLHPYYQSTFGWRPEDLPVATGIWERLVSLPIFPGMRQEEVEHVVDAVRGLCARHLRRAGVANSGSKG
jgi:perosamine synthetase